MLLAEGGELSMLMGIGCGCLTYRHMSYLGCPRPCQYRIIGSMYNIWVSNQYLIESNEMLRGVLKACHDNCSVKQAG